MMPNTYRRNAGIIVFNKQRQVLLCKRIDVGDAWQFPQGGIEAGETVTEAALRELKEETSLENVQLVQSLEAPARYTFPPQIAAAMHSRGIKDIGQDIYWSFVFFDGDDAQINLHTENPEFSQYRWDTMQHACDLIVDFKKDAYQKAKAAFETIAENFMEKVNQSE